METQIKTKITTDKIVLNSAFSPDNNKLFRQWGGKWVKAAEWVFTNNQTIMDKIQKRFGLSDEVVTVEIKEADYSGRAFLQVGGYVLASRSGRDDIVRMPAGVMLKKGEFFETGGSVKHPSVYNHATHSVDQDWIFELNVRRDFALDNNLKIVREASVSLEQLKEKREDLQRQLNEIERLISTF